MRFLPSTLFVWLLLTINILAAPSNSAHEKRATQVSLKSYTYTGSTLAGSVKVRGSG